MVSDFFFRNVESLSFGVYTLAKGVSPVGLARIQAVRVLGHVVVERICKTFIVGLVVLAIIDNKFQCILAVVLAISRSLLVKSNGGAQVSSDHLSTGQTLEQAHGG